MIELFPEPVWPNMTIFLFRRRVCYIQSASSLCSNASQEVEHILRGRLHLEVGVGVWVVLVVDVHVPGCWSIELLLVIEYTYPHRC
jgi:hypothetical protein